MSVSGHYPEMVKTGHILTPYSFTMLFLIILPPALSFSELSLSVRFSDCGVVVFFSPMHFTGKFKLQVRRFCIFIKVKLYRTTHSILLEFITFTIFVETADCDSDVLLSAKYSPQNSVLNHAGLLHSRIVKIKA